MEINIGDKIQYTFPNPDKASNKFVLGTVEFINEFFIVIITDEKVKIKINFKNFDKILNLETGKTVYIKAV
ncbi:MAG: hypothetical protein C4543_09765 [Ignavibacteriales bacterium]|jgi:hypothetical protein|nr:MAG: hypothetical protein C4543_09765 [Ignavibacteriales bacterium]